MSDAGESTLRTDARRNAERIRVAAVAVFRERGLSVPLEAIAEAARVSKATIFNRFGGRVGLIDAVIDEVVEAELEDIIAQARSVSDLRRRVAFYVGALRDLQYRLPAVNDVLLQEFPDSEPLMALCHVGSAFHDDLVAEGHSMGVLADGFSSEDFHALAVENAVVLKFGSRPTRADYDRRTGFVLGGILANG